MVQTRSQKAPLLAGVEVPVKKRRNTSKTGTKDKPNVASAAVTESQTTGSLDAGAQKREGVDEVAVSSAPETANEPAVQPPTQLPRIASGSHPAQKRTYPFDGDTSTQERQPKKGHNTGEQEPSTGQRPASPVTASHNQGPQTRPGPTATAKVAVSSHTALPVRPDPNPCVRLVTDLLRWEQAAGRAPSNFYDPFSRGRGRHMDDDVLFTAIAAVTEAVPGGRFSYIDPLAFSAAEAGVHAAQAVRPEHEVIIPYTRDHHHTLFVFRQSEQAHSAGGVPVPTFDALHYDSFPRAYEGDHATRAQRHAFDIRRRLCHMGWSANQNFLQEIVPRRNTVPQSGSWTCGIHVVLNAWAYALGLEMAGDENEEHPHLAQYDQLIIDAMRVIRLAVRGYMSSSTIESFLRCYGFVNFDSVVPADRRFGRTTPFATIERVASYPRDLLAVIQLQPLFAVYLAMPLILGNALRCIDFVREFVGEVDLQSMDADTLSDLMTQSIRVMNTRSAPTTMEALQRLTIAPEPAVPASEASSSNAQPESAERDDDDMLDADLFGEDMDSDELYGEEGQGA